MSKTNFLQVKANCISNEKFINVGIKATENAKKLPICLYCVVDISGSMGSSITEDDEANITRMDLVIHSLKTIANSLDEDDNFCLIPFNSFAEVTLSETKAKDKNKIIKAIEELYPNGCTNIYDGLELAIKTLNKTANKNINNYIMIFTDGQDNSRTDVELFFSKTFNENDCKSYTVSTFSFGYDVDSFLMERIAKVGNGIYGYCPDFTMVGTIFINFLANIKSTIYTSIQVGLTVKERNNPSKTFSEVVRIGGIYMGMERNALFDVSKADFNFMDIEGKVSVEVIGSSIKTEFQWYGNEDGQTVVNTVEYLEQKNQEAGANGESNSISDDEEDTNGINHINNNENGNNNNNNDDDDDMADDDDDNDNKDTKKPTTTDDNDIEQVDRYINISQMDKLLNQVYRFKLLQNILKENNDDNIDLDEVTRGIDTLYDELKSYYYRTEFMKGILYDLKSNNPNRGQIQKAFQSDFYMRWGRDYLKSYKRFHILEQCGNFKDCSLQPYSGRYFIEKRNMASKIFLNTEFVISESSKKSKGRNRNINSRRNRSAGNNSTRTATVNTRQFYNANGGCFDGDALVLLKGKAVKRVRDLRKGDYLSNGTKVCCVVEQPLIFDNPMDQKVNENLVCNIEGVQFSCYHPILYQGKWCFPCDLVEPKPSLLLDAWFNLVLEDTTEKKEKSTHEIEFIINSNNSSPSLKAITLGHGRTDNAILSHPYFGTEKVVQALKAKYPSEFLSGYIVVKHVSIERETISSNNQKLMINNYY